MPTTKKKKKRRSGAKIATKREQTELVQHAHRLADDPSPLVPVVEGVPARQANRLRRRLQRIARLKGRPALLKWYVRFGPPLARAYANLLLVRESGKAARMASLKTPVGELKYAVRGTNLGARHQVAVQHFRHPEARIAGYRDLAQKSGGVIWATEDGLVLRARDAPPPDAWFDLLSTRLPIALTRLGNDLYCPHLAEAADPHAPSAPHGLEIQIATGPLRFLVCGACARDRFRAGAPPLIGHAGRLAIGFNARRDITVAPTGTPRTCVHEGTCAWVRHPPELADRTLDTYRAGAMSEADLLERLGPRWEEAVRAAGDRLLVAGDWCHGPDEAGLLDALGLAGETREVVARFLTAGPKVLMARERTVNQILEACWEAAPAILADLHPHAEELAALLERHRRSPPLVIVEEVLEARRAAAALKGYPVYTKLGERARVADRLARAALIGGMGAVVGAVDQELKRASHKGLLWAALRVAGGTAGREWQFSKPDQEAGEFLEEPLRALLGARPGEYHAALAHVHMLAGGSGEVPAPKGAG